MSLQDLILVDFLSGYNTAPGIAPAKPAAFTDLRSSVRSRKGSSAASRVAALQSISWTNGADTLLLADVS
jgi:hypothetical protein